jgi:hypothetical protein
MKDSPDQIDWQRGIAANIATYNPAFYSRKSEQELISL